MDFAEYAAARRTSLVRAAVLLGCPVDDAEDLVHTTLTRCLRAWTRVERAERPDAYVHRMLVNALHDARSRHWRGEVPTEHLPDPVGDEPDLDTGLAVRRALAAMSPDHREVLVLRYYADLTEQETARVLGVPVGTVKSRASRALRILAADATIERSS